MDEERSKLVSEILDKLYDKDSNKKGIIGVSKNPNTKKTIGYSYPGLDDKDTIDRLESLGFKIIYPAPLDKDRVDGMDVAEKTTYDLRMKNALVVDTKGEHSLELESIIADRYFSMGYAGISGFNKDKNSTTRFAGQPMGDFGDREELFENYQKIIKGVGFDTELTKEGNFEILSDVPYPVVENSKFKQLFSKVRGKAKEAFDKIKSVFKPKEKEKENNLEER